MSIYPLPPLILLEDYKGDWETYKKTLYTLFLETIVNKLTFLNLPISCRYFQPIGDMHRSFWHLITEGALNDEERIPDMRRCERIPWIAHLLKHQHATELGCWENKRGSNTNTILWLPPENYMIVLSKRSNYYLLSTAYLHNDRKAIVNEKERRTYNDPRKAEAASATSNTLSTLR